MRKPKVKLIKYRSLVNIDHQPDHVISSNNIKASTILEVYKNLKDEERNKLLDLILPKLISIEFITNSIREKKLLDVETYRIKVNSDIGVKRKYQKKDENFELSSFKRIKTISPVDRNNIVDTHLNPVKSNSLNKSDVKFSRNNRINELISLSQNNINNNIAISNKELFEKIQNEIKNSINTDEEEHMNTNNSDEEDKSVSEISYSLNIFTPSVSDMPSQSQSILTQSSAKFKPDQNKFAFNSGTTQTNLNEHITKELEKVLEFHTNENNVFESLAYRKAIAQIKNAKEKITSCDQLKSFKYLGKSIGNKVKEIILTGRLKKGEFVGNDDRVKTIKLLQSVWGIGMKQANTLYRKGIKSIEELRKNENLLATNQKIGLKYYEDLITRIPRAEIDEIFNIIKAELFLILPEDQIKIEVCGSYRRGKSSCGDIDIIITRKDNDYIDGILQSLIDTLMQRGLVIEILQLGGHGNRYQFMGICRLGLNPARRIDIKIYKKNNFPFALLYFTGSAYFNRSMRLFASKLGYQLSDFHLKKRNAEEEYVICETEEDIFNALGIDYKTPEERDI